MKSTPTFKILGLVTLAGILLYFGVQGYRYFSDTMRQTQVYASASEDVISLNGWLVREEEAFSFTGGTLDHAQTEGAKVGVGQTLAVVYHSADALNTVDRIEALELQLEQLEFARNSFLDPDAVLKLDSTIASDLTALCQNISGGDYSSPGRELNSVKAAIMKRDHTYGSLDEIDGRISQVKSEISSLRATLSGATAITTPQSGTFSATCDGYESVLTPAFLEEITPEQLDHLSPASANGTVGKMIYGDTWYYTAVISQQDVERLGKRDTVVLRFAKGLNFDITMDVEKITKSENGKSVLVLSCQSYLPETTLLRYQAADIILHTYEGLRVNANALRVSDGQSGVYCVIGATARFKPVDVVYEGDGFVLVRPAQSALADPTGVTILRVGDQAITTAGELSNGKVIS